MAEKKKSELSAKTTYAKEGRCFTMTCRSTERLVHAKFSDGRFEGILCVDCLHAELEPEVTLGVAERKTA